jgi:hypothetical protein
LITTLFLCRARDFLGDVGRDTHTY